MTCKVTKSDINSIMDWGDSCMDEVKVPLYSRPLFHLGGTESGLNTTINIVSSVIHSIGLARY